MLVTIVPRNLHSCTNHSQELQLYFFGKSHLPHSGQRRKCHLETATWKMAFSRMNFARCIFFKLPISFKYHL